MRVNSKPSPSRASHNQRNDTIFKELAAGRYKGEVEKVRTTNNRIIVTYKIVTPGGKTQRLVESRKVQLPAGSQIHVITRNRMVAGFECPVVRHVVSVYDDE
jgi:hypothetical protein